MENSEKPIYPVPHQNDDRSIQYDVHFGLTKREYFAGLAMQGILSNPANAEQFKVNDWGVNGTAIADNAVHCADELLKQLEKTKTI